MFTRFYYKELTEIQVLHQQLIVVYDLYLTKNSNLHSALNALLVDAESYYKTREDYNLISWAQSLMSELQMAKKGIHPFTLEKAATHRHELTMIACYKILQNFNEKISVETLRLTNKLNEASELLKQILLSALTLQIISMDELRQAGTQTQKVKIWNKLSASQIGNQQQLISLALMVSAFDIYIIMDTLRLFIS